MKNFLLILVASAVISACNNDQSTSSNLSKEVSFEVQKPAIKEGIKKQIFSIKVDEGAIVKTQKESIISIPKDALVYADGTPLADEASVEIAYEEFNDPSEIILSGIPMTIMVENEPIPFISDGMFNMSATCDGKKLKISEGKEISVFTVSSKSEPSFKYWNFNKDKGAWQDLGERNKTLNNEEVKEEIAKENLAALNSTNEEVQQILEPSLESEKSVAAVSKPSAPINIKPNDFTFNISNDRLSNDKLELYTNMIWKPEKSLTREEQRKLIQDIEEPSASLSISCIDENDQLYQLNYQGKSLQMRPVLLGKSKEEAQKRFNKRMNKYEEALQEKIRQKRRAEKARENRQKVYNFFSVKKMGIYNCDRYYKYKGERKGYTFKARNKQLINNVFAVLKGGVGVIALSSVYLKKGKFKLPKKDISGFIYSSPEGDLMQAQDRSSSSSGDEELDFTLFSSDANGENLERLIQSFD